jgi:hypothetical protein
VAYTLNFTSLHTYNPAEHSITIPIALSLRDVAVSFAAKLDTGASFCIFNRTYGEALRLDIETGHPEWVGTATGRFQVFGHNVTLTVSDFEFDTLVYFAADPGFSRNVLGRQGWLDQVRLGIIDYDGGLYISRYEDE